MSNEATTEEQKIAELQKQVDFLSALLDSLPFNVFAKNKNFQYVYNNAFYNVFNNVKPGTIYGKTDYEVFHSKELSERYRASDLKIINEKASFRDYIPTLSKNEVSYHEIFKQPLMMNNEVQGMVGVVIPPAPEIKNQNVVYKDFNDNSPAIIFDYFIVTNQLEILKDIPEFDIFENNRFKKESIVPEDYHIIENFYEEIKSQPANIVHLIRFLNKNGEVALCHFELKLFYDKDMNLTRFSGLIRPVNNANKRDEILSVEIINAKKSIFSKIRESYDLCLYVNLAYNLYYIYQAGSVFKNIVQVGEWNSFIDNIVEFLHPSDFGILKKIFQTLSDNPEENNNEQIMFREFRIKENDGEYRWKKFETQKLKSTIDDSFLLLIFDVNESVIERNKRNVREINTELIETLSTIVEFRDLESGEHISRIKTFTKILLKTAQKLIEGVEYTNELIEIISAASAMHDIGKIAIPDNILLKPGRLTAEEFETMKTHTIKGCEILQTIPQIQEATYFKYSYDICRHHHERYDGHGYPDGLKGDEISLEAQIVSLADVFDALTSKRCYKEAYSLDKAAKMIVNGECGVFSEKILECFKFSLPEMKKFCLSQTC